MQSLIHGRRNIYCQVKFQVVHNSWGKIIMSSSWMVVAARKSDYTNRAKKESCGYALTESLGKAMMWFYYYSGQQSHYAFLILSVFEILGSGDFQVLLNFKKLLLWHTPMILALREQEQDHRIINLELAYKASSRIAWSKWDYATKNKQKKINPPKYFY